MRSTSCFLVFFLAAFLAASLTGLPALADSLEPTPETGLGPFFPVQDGSESDPDLTRVDGSDGKPQGEVIVVQGTVRAADGKALSGAEVVIWQTDVHGKYRHPREDRRTADGEPIPVDPAFQYWGRTTTADDGGYRFRTIIPGAYGRVRHIHFRIQHPDHGSLGTELHFAGDRHDGDFVTSPKEHDRLAVPLVPVDGEPGVKRAVFDVVLD